MSTGFRRTGSSVGASSASGYGYKASDGTGYTGVGATKKVVKATPTPSRHHNNPGVAPRREDYHTTTSSYSEEQARRAQKEREEEEKRRRKQQKHEAKEREKAKAASTSTTTVLSGPRSLCDILGGSKKHTAAPRSTGQKYCTGCGRALDTPTPRFCSACGKPTNPERRCSRCNKVLKSTDRFCPDCGTRC